MSRLNLRALRPDRVVIIKPSALGDVVNAFHALSALRAHWPNSAISWVINRSLRDLVAGHPQIDVVIDYDRGGGPAGFARLLKRLRDGRFDVTIDMQGLLRSGLMTRATGAPVRVGWKDAREGARWFYTHTVDAPLDGSHAVDRLLAIASAFGADGANARPSVAISENDRDWARRELAGVGRPRLAINLGARWETKRWPPEHFAEVARRAVEARGAGLLALGAPEDRPFVDAFLRQLDPIPVADFCGRTSLPRIAALAEQCDVVLSNDTGPLHLASASGARVVGVYTCTSPRLNGPYGPRARAVETEVWCKASYLVRCPRHLECMSELTPDRVWPVVLAQLDAEILSHDVAPARSLSTGDA